MRILLHAIVMLLIGALSVPPACAAQGIDSADAWRSFARNVEAGADLNVKLRNGQAFRATAVTARDDSFVLQPRTRVAVEVVAVPYTEIAAITRRGSGGIGAGKAAAIGIAVGAGAFVALLFAVFSTID